MMFSLFHSIDKAPHPTSTEIMGSKRATPTPALCASDDELLGELEG